MDIPDIIDMQLYQDSLNNSFNILENYDIHNINICCSSIFLICILIFLYKNFYEINILLGNIDIKVSSENNIEKVITKIQDYKQQYRELQDIELTKDQLREINKAHTKLSTKNGDIIIKYNVENQRYDYWCDDNTISYTYLDIAARKFAIDNNCKQLCVDYEEECKLAYKKLNEPQQDTNQINSVSLMKNSVFANLKSKTKTMNKTKNTKTSYIPEKCNTFKRCGKISEFNTKPKLIKQPVQEINYSDWKKLK